MSDVAVIPLKVTKSLACAPFAASATVRIVVPTPALPVLDRTVKLGLPGDAGLRIGVMS